LLRLCFAVALLYFGIAGVSDPTESMVYAQDILGAACGVFLIAGLWTPVIGTLAGLVEVWIALLHHSPRQEHTWIHIFLAMLAASVAMLGPGAWSIDARLFGRKRFDIDGSRGRYSSL
jgi:putative oxidoreductase